MKACKYHPQRKVNPYRKGVDYNYMKTAEWSFKPDNYMTKYDEKNKKNDVVKWKSSYATLEDKIKKSIKEEFEWWNNPCYFQVINPQEPPYKHEYKKIPDYDIKEGDYPSIREMLSMDDSRFDRNDRHQRIRVPSMKRSNKEWEKFYRLWPSIACEVATGERRFIDGAKLKYIPLFKNILDEIWPIDAKRSYNLFNKSNLWKNKNI